MMAPCFDAAGHLDQYEALRQRYGHGLALFLSQGMAAWMNAVSLLGASVVWPTPPSSGLSPARCTVGWPTTQQADLTILLANMVLNCTQEITG